MMASTHTTQLHMSTHTHTHHYLFMNASTVNNVRNLIKQEAKLTAPGAALGHGQVDKIPRLNTQSHTHTQQGKVE